MSNPEPQIDRLIEIMARLRAPDGCPWDQKQTLESLKPYCIEEAYEVLDAIDSGDTKEHCEELGDLLLQVVFQSQLRAEEEAFTFDDVARAISDKLVRRHPHVFGDLDVADADEVLRNWDAIKQTEKGGAPKSLIEGIPANFPALMQAHEMQKRAGRGGFDWDDVQPALEKVDEETAEVKEALAAGESEHAIKELGDLIFAAVNCIRLLGGRAEDTVRETNQRFRSRFQYIESQVETAGKAMTDCSLDELEAHWQAAKGLEVSSTQEEG